jgi:glyoxylase-like metal-dependent hydrolase (beta-lactamase superfamily II)
MFPRWVYAYLVNEAWGRVELLPDEAAVLPGLDVFWVGGHTSCSQAIKIETAQGHIILAGDTLFLFGNLEENIPVAYCTNLAECYHAMDRFRADGDLVLPNHDPLLVERYPDGVVA